MNAVVYSFVYVCARACVCVCVCEQRPRGEDDQEPVERVVVVEQQVGP